MYVMTIRSFYSSNFDVAYEEIFAVIYASPYSVSSQGQKIGLILHTHKMVIKFPG